ncbi:LacI family transcriptional regulator [Mobilisporobacter senegalensis]|uniref:LacI family transcriptional regulator n=1 Tax=Mobilisporobacter senegalensis TaxID=1329262 RepID=A0A3N1XL24_9FIRM|nr:LacI family DNA-binding transcriptional regulator [Mobilisporobacter senegalensis]ROR27413.1 LacI family transcriptional regulator [Mobilisporobacter senegalensis]
MEKKITIRDVAKHAGVSVASVSYALNGKDKLSPETKQRIMEAIEELEYEPSLTARCLSNGDSKLIGVTLPITEKGDIPGVLLNNPFFGEFISGVEYVIRKEGYDILFSGVETDRQYKDWIQRRRLDGIIMLGVYPHSLLKEIKNLDIPIALTDAYEDYTKDFHRVMVEDKLGGYLATKHLIEMGHTEIAFVTGSLKKSPLNNQRYLGYLQALEEADLEVKEEYFIEEHVNFEGGYKAGIELLKRKIKATAIFAIADIMAIGLMKAFRENNKDIPGDYSIIGFDDIKFASYVTPGLTTMKQDIMKKGMICAEMVLEALQKKSSERKTVILKPELIIRDSIRKIK